MFERYYRELLGFVSRRLRNQDDAADIAQETYLRVLAAERLGVAASAPRALLFRTARNLLVDRHRRALVRQDDEDRDLLDDLPACPSREPEHLAADRQMIDALLETIESLPPRCREAFVMHRFEGLSHAEIAEIMGISRNMVEKHMIRALLACKACEDQVEGGRG